ncbi:BTB/POZ domain-containing protein [Rhizophagus irregularis DAOM 181602=DAOM 197198]|nr:BTB/POZ domain-containing protein [Rhizophagus irregularis DAOM 181602=DAOM 197198]
MSYNFKSNLSEALGQLLKIGTDYNVIIQVGEGFNFKEFHAHSIILCCRSRYFNKILSDENIEKKDGKYVIKKPNISSRMFDDILKYLYTDRINISDKTGTELLNFMIVADELMLESLTKLVENSFIYNYRQFLQNDPVEILQIVHYREVFDNLRNFCLNKICSRPKLLFNSDKFTQLSAPLLEIVLKRDDLNLREIEIWRYIIKWGLAQDQILSQDVSKWNMDHINILKRILYKFIPLIKFHEISNEDYISKVKPYEEILSQELRDEILRNYKIPGRKQITDLISTDLLESVLVNRRHIALIVIGGYNPLFWDSSNSCNSTKNSFLFSFTDKNDLQSAKVVYSKGDLNSIRSYSQWGPVFGTDLHAAYIPTIDSWRASVCSYPSLNLPSIFKIEDYEVFQVHIK